MGLTRITSDGITDATIATADLADQSVSLAKLPHGTSSNDGKFLRANNGADPTFESVVTDLVGDSSPQLGGDLDTNSHHILIDDDHEIKFGASSDLRIFHEASGNTRIVESGSGELYLDTSSFRIRNAAGSEIVAKFISDGACELYHDNDLHFATTSQGCKTNGDLSFQGDGGSEQVLFDASDNSLKLTQDSVRLKIGAGEDLQIYHNGTKSIIDNNTGDLSIETTANEVHSVQSEFQVKVKGGDEDGLKVITDGAVELYYDNALRLDTMIEGAKVKRHGGGSTTLYVEGAEGSSAILALYADDGDDNADKYRIVASSGGGLYFSNYIDGAWETNIKFTETTGGVELYYNNSKKLETTGSGVNVTGTVTSSSHIISGGMVDISDNNQLRLGDDQDMMISHDGTSGAIRNATGELYVRSDGIRLVNNGNSETFLTALNNGAVELYHNNSKKFETTANGFITQNSGQSTILIGSTGANGARIILDGDSNGDGAGGDFATIEHDTTGNLHIRTDNPAHGCLMAFSTNGTVRTIIDSDGTLRPFANNTNDLGSNSVRWRNIYTNDLNLSNEGGSNDVDGTWGSYTIQEGAEDLFLVNKRNGKKYKFNLTEVS